MTPERVAIDMVMPLRYSCAEHGTEGCYHIADRREYHYETITATVRHLLREGWKPPVEGGAK